LVPLTADSSASEDAGAAAIRAKYAAELRQYHIEQAVMDEAAVEKAAEEAQVAAMEVHRAALEQAHAKAGELAKTGMVIDVDGDGTVGSADAAASAAAAADLAQAEAIQAAAAVGAGLVWDVHAFKWVPGPRPSDMPDTEGGKGSAPSGLLPGSSAGGDASGAGVPDAKGEPSPTASSSPTSPALPQDNAEDPFASTGSGVVKSPRRSASGGRHAPYGADSGIAEATLGARVVKNEQFDPGSQSLAERMASPEAADGP
jgi:uncharacterized protein YciI